MTCAETKVPKPHSMCDYSSAIIYMSCKKTWLNTLHSELDWVYYLIRVLNIVACEEGWTPTVYGRAHILGRTDYNSEHDEEDRRVSVIETVDDVIVVANVDLGDRRNSADEAVVASRRCCCGGLLLLLLRPQRSERRTQRTERSREEEKREDITVNRKKRSVVPCWRIPRGCW